MKSYVYKRKKQPLYKLFKIIMRPFVKKPKIINKNETIENKSIILCTHCGKWGPLSLSFHFPAKYACWGAHEMLESYKERRAYLIDVLYTQKLGHKKTWFLKFKASFEAIFNKIFYKGMKVIPSYQDFHFIQTIKDSIETIGNDLPVLIFPEDSNEGYFEYLKSTFPGFIYLSERYLKKKGVDLPIYTCYFHYDKKILIIDKPVYLEDLKKEGMDKDQICEYFTNKINNLYKDYLNEQ